jgi:NAD-dependent dihydropyrimidine dehydrogenase PreA subunit
MGRFVEVRIAGDLDRAQAEAVVRACPVDIFALDRCGALTSAPEREDECILCGRCVTIAPEDVSVRRRYGDQRPVEAAEATGA